MTDRLVKSSDLPRTLWQVDDGMLVLPAAVSRVYRNMLAEKGLMDEALNAHSDDGPVGGIKDSDTRRHFSARFSGSSARAQLAVLDPKDDLRNASDLFVKTFSGGKVGLLDIPCGAGAASAALLGCVAKSTHIVTLEGIHKTLLGRFRPDLAEKNFSVIKEAYKEAKPE